MYQRNEFIGEVADAVKERLDEVEPSMSPIDFAIFKSGFREGLDTLLRLTGSNQRTEGYRIYKVEVAPVGGPITQWDMDNSLERQCKPYHSLVQEIWMEVNS